MRLFKKKVFSIIVALIMIVSITTIPTKATTLMTEGKFDLYSSVYDFGARVDKVIIKLPNKVSGDSVSADTFIIESANESNANIEVNNGKRIISDIYVSTSADGSKEEVGEFIIINLETKLSTKYADVLQWNDPDFTNVPLKVKYNVKQEKPMKDTEGNEFKYNYIQDKFIQVEVDKFGEGRSTSGLNYRDYKPESDGQKHPLIIWLHGAGEGGDNNVTHINGNRGAVAFISDEAQKAFDNPYVLAPQSPDYWMPELVLGDLVIKGTDNTEKVVDLIKEYISNNSEIDTSRVYIGGCSMGGYQTWETLFAAPELFAAAFPICAAYEVPEKKLDTVKNIPIWVVHAANDDTIPVKYTQDAYNYLKSKGGNVLYTEYSNVQVDGEDFAPHASWIYPLNNDPVNEGGEHFYEWLASQRKDVAANTNNNSNIVTVVVVIILVLCIGGVFVIRKKKINETIKK